MMDNVHIHSGKPLGTAMTHYDEEQMPLAELKQRTTFRGLNPLAERSVLVALQRRYKVLSEV